MRLTKTLGTLLLAIWLILFGVLTATFFRVSFTSSADVLAILAMVTGVVLLLTRS
jgi:hypothetical protein